MEKIREQDKMEILPVKKINAQNGYSYDTFNGVAGGLQYC